MSSNKLVIIRLDLDSTVCHPFLQGLDVQRKVAIKRDYFVTHLLFQAENLTRTIALNYGYIVFICYCRLRMSGEQQKAIVITVLLIDCLG